MWLMQLVRTAWRALLAVTPRPVLQRLDTWARERAQRRAERRRRQLTLPQR